jgi:hypothetical protein
MNDKHIVWIDRGREPQVAPNPNFPDGRDIDVSNGETACTVELPYPAKRIGLYVITCRTCGSTTGVTTAGRPDDPRSVTIPCKVTMQ